MPLIRLRIGGIERHRAERSGQTPRVTCSQEYVTVVMDRGTQGSRELFRGDRARVILSFSGGKTLSYREEDGHGKDQNPVRELRSPPGGRR